MTKDDSGRYILLASEPGINLNKYLEELTNYLKSKNKYVKVFNSLGEFDDTLINLLQKIEMSSEIEIDLTSNLYLYSAVLSRINYKIKKYTESGITCLVVNSYLSLLSQIYLNFFGTDSYYEYYETIKKEFRLLKPDIFLLFSNNNIKNKKLLAFYNQEVKAESIKKIIYSEDLKNIDEVISQINSLHHNSSNKLKIEQNKVSKDKTSYKIISINKISLLLVEEFKKFSNIIQINKIKILPVKEDNIFVPKFKLNSDRTLYLKLCDRINKLNKQIGKVESRKLILLNRCAVIEIQFEVKDFDKILYILKNINLEETNEIYKNLLKFDKSKSKTTKKISDNGIKEKIISTNYDSIDELNPKIVSYYPKNENEYLYEYFYDISGLKYSTLRNKINGLGYKEKIKILQEEFTKNVYQDPLKEYDGLGFYVFEVYLSLISIENLKKALPNLEFKFQELTSRYGYFVPEEINVEQSKIYDEAFDISLKIQNLLTTSNNSSNIKYSYLTGHLIRIEIKLDFKDVITLLKVDFVDKELVKLRNELSNELKSIHPIIFEHINS